MMNIRQVASDEITLKNVKQEIRMHWELQNSHSIVKLREIFIDGESIGMLLDYQKQGTIIKKI